MSDEKRQFFLRRMTRGGRPEPEFGEISPSKALRLALAKAGQETLNQVVDGSGIEERRAPLPHLGEMCQDGGLTILLHGPEDAKGLISLDRACVSAITEGLTMGTISKSPPADRTPTAVDSLLCQRFITLMLTMLAARLLGHPAAEWATGFTPEEQISDLRRLPLLMDDEMYRIVTVSIDFAGGTKIGQMSLIVPWDGRHTTSPKPKAVERTADQDQEWRAELEKAVMPAEVVLEAVLYHFKVPLSQMKTWEVGTVIPIPRRSVAEVSLRDGNGEKVSVVRLGQSQGFRAVRLEHAPLRPDLSPNTDLNTGDAGLPAPFSMSDAMAAAPAYGGGVGAMADIDIDTEDDDYGGMAMDLPSLSDTEEEGELPPLDLGDLNMADLDDLPMTIE